MAIPTWTWSNRGTSRPAATARHDVDPETDVSSAADEFELLASPVRLEILLALADGDEPLRYTDLRAATSVDDNGKLNYHLRKLEAYVSNDDGEYVLTRRGRQLLDRVS